MKVRNVFMLSLGLILLSYFITDLWIERKLTQKLAENPNLSYNKLSVSLWGGDLYLQDVAYLSAANETAADTLSIDTLQVEGVSYLSLFTSKTLKVSRLLLAGVRGTYVLPTNEYCEEEDTTTDEEKNWTTIQLGSIEIKGENIKVKKAMEWEVSTATAALELANYSYSPTAPLCPKGWNTFAGKLATFEFRAIKSPYIYRCGGLEVAGKDKQLVLSEFEILPVYSKADWSYQFPYKKSRLSLNVTKIQATNFAFEQLINGEGITADSLQLYRPQLEVYSNELKQPCTDCYKPLLHEKIHQMGMLLDVSLATIEQGEVVVDTWSSDAEQKIALTFSQLYASIYDLTNQAGRGPIVMDTQTNLFDDVPLAVKFKLHLHAPDYPYSYEGQLAPVNLIQLNEILGAGSRVDINSGHISHLHFAASGNNSLTTGELQLKYDELEIGLRNDEHQPRKFVSALLNKLVIANESEGLETGTIHYPRDPHHGFFHQCWHSLRSGLSSIILPDLLLRRELK